MPALQMTPGKTELKDPPELKGISPPWKDHKQIQPLYHEIRYTTEKLIHSTYIHMEINVADITGTNDSEFPPQTSTHVKIQEANYGDCKRLVKLHNRAFLSAADPYTPLTEEDMMRVLTSPSNTVLIATISGEDAGFIILSFDYYPSLDPEINDHNVVDGPAMPPMHEENPAYNVGYISVLAVDPHWQRRGIGKTLGLASWRYFKARQLVKLKCEVFENNTASYRLISALGFRNVGFKTYPLESQHLGWSPPVQ